MTGTTGQHKEMENRVHEPPLIEAVKDCACNVTPSFRHNPCDNIHADRSDKRSEYDKYRQTHANETDRFQITVFLQSYKTYGGSDYCA